MYRKILVALENSQADRAIVAHIDELARLTHATLVLVHVADGWVARNWGHLNLAESEEIRQDRAYLESVRERFASSGIPAEAVLLMGEPADQIVRVAEERQVDLIAMSTHGHRFLADLLFGSTARKVRHTVEIPVLLLKAQR
ncbi:MAG: universal stress protein [bacterium]